ncbi:MAG: hypothetical protein LC803_22090 [Acidobacteria bacterium]|nr:hypothetical protein [Acidobacteriota bacterium]
MSEERTQGQDKDKDKGKQPRVTLQVQTPRGLWSTTAPADAAKRPVYEISTKVAQVVADARAVFKFTESDNKYVLLQGSAALDPERPLASYHFAGDTLLVLSVQGGNA